MTWCHSSTWLSSKMTCEIKKSKEIYALFFVLVCTLITTLLLLWHLWSPKLEVTDEIHIVFDTFRHTEDSIKHGERERRGKSKNMVVLDLLVIFHQQNWFSGILCSLYLGISPQTWIVSDATQFPRHNCTHEDADDRMMFHVQDILSHRTGSTGSTGSLSLSSGDTDVFVCLLYHIRQLEKSWPPRAQAYPQLRSEKIIITSWYLHSAGRRAHTVCDKTSKMSTNLWFSISTVHSKQRGQRGQQTDMETFDDLHSIVMSLRWTLRGPLAPQLMQENICKEPIINSSFGSKHLLQTSPWS